MNSLTFSAAQYLYHRNFDMRRKKRAIGEAEKQVTRPYQPSVLVNTC